MNGVFDPAYGTHGVKDPDEVRLALAKLSERRLEASREPEEIFLRLFGRRFVGTATVESLEHPNRIGHEGFVAAGDQSIEMKERRHSAYRVGTAAESEHE